jgi:hypothetical protein
MTPCFAMQTRSPIALTEEVRPEVRERAEVTARSGHGIVLINLWPEPSLLVCPLSQGTGPLAPPRAISDEPTESGDWLESQHPWAPKGTAEFEVTERMSWPRIELDY